jgi:hypothetical protein
LIQLQNETQQLLQMINRRGPRVSDEQLNQALSLVRQAQSQLTLRTPRQLCANDDISALSVATKTIKDFAYASDGLNLTDAAATQYALDWTKTYPCNAANEFARVGKNLRNYAYGSNGLNLASSAAADYVETSITRVCDLSVDYVVEGKKFYDYAYSSSGLNMTSSQASAYTRQKIEERYLTCSNGDVFWGL